MKVLGSRYARFVRYTINGLKQVIYGNNFGCSVDLGSYGKAQFRDLQLKGAMSAKFQSCEALQPELFGPS
jgi:hypothetical protein